MTWKQMWHFQNLKNWKFCKYLHFFQNAVPAILTFSAAILKSHKLKTYVSVKKSAKQNKSKQTNKQTNKQNDSTSEKAQCVIQYRISLIENPQKFELY